MGRQKKFKSGNTNRFFCSQSSGRFRRQFPQWLPQSSSNRNGNHNPRDSDTDNNEIPGFFFDSDAQTYFKITPENQKFFAEKKFKAKQNQTKVSVPNLKTAYRHRRLLCEPKQSIACEIADFQYQSVTFQAYQNHITSTKMKTMSEVSRVEIDLVEPQYCQTMVGNPALGSVVGAWTTPLGTTVFSHNFKNNSESEGSVLGESPIINIHFNHVMTDMCFAKIDDSLEFVLYVGNPSRPSADELPNHSTMHLLPVRHLCDLSGSENRLCLESMSLNMEEEVSALWSCAWNQCMQRMAFGCEESTLLISLQYAPNTCESKLHIPRENSFSLEFNDSGNALYCGTNKGNLKCFDLRSNKLSSSIKLNRGLSYLKLLSSEEHVIASCYDHKLFQVDLRAQKVIVEYLEHNNEHLKLPVSISEKNGFVCSVGQDRSTRIWNLKHGNLIVSVPPVTESQFHPHAWFSEEWDFGKCSSETALVVNEGTEFIIYKPQI